jgi:hypothetical protein
MEKLNSLTPLAAPNIQALVSRAPIALSKQESDDFVNGA